MTGSAAEKLFELPCSPVLSSDDAGWNTAQLTLFEQPPHQIPEHVSPYHVVCINAGADVMLEQSIDGQAYVGESVSGDIGIYPAHLWQAFEWHQPAKFLQLYLEPVLLNRIGSELYGQDSVELLPQPAFFDPVITQIAIALRNTLTAQKASSQLYADTMANALATHLVHHYSPQQKTRQARTETGRLSARQLKQVTDYIDAHLAEDISLAELAKTVALSSFHFARLFKSSMGHAPHQYHIRCRVKRSKELLLEKELSIAHIAQVVGFASQSHLNYHFKRVVGLTPTAFLRQ